MGNKHSSDVSDDVKRQADSQTDSQTPIYKFVDLGGGGELIELMKKATEDNNYEEVSFCNSTTGCSKKAESCMIQLCDNLGKSTPILTTVYTILLQQEMHDACG